MPEIGNVAIVNAPQNMSTLDWVQIYGKEVFFVHTFKGYDYTLMKKTIKGIQVRYSS
jgi:hypothetical protein